MDSESNQELFPWQSVIMVMKQRSLLKWLMILSMVLVNLCSLQAKQQSGKVSQHDAILTYRLNGVDLQVAKFVKGVKAGDYIGRKMYEAQKEGLEVVEGPEARLLAMLFSKQNEIYDCFYAKRKDESGTLYMAKQIDEATCVAVEVQIPDYKNISKSFDDGFPEFSGSRLTVSLEIIYSDGNKNFSNIYTTKKTDMQAIIAHYRKWIQKNGWTVMNEEKDPKMYVCMLTKAEQLYILSVNFMGKGRYMINIAG